MAKHVMQKTAEDRTRPGITAPARGRKGSRVEKDGIPSEVGGCVGENSRQNSGRNAHCRANDSRPSPSSLKADSLPMLSSKMESISSANRLRKAGGCSRKT